MLKLRLSQGRKGEFLPGPPEISTAEQQPLKNINKIFIESLPAVIE
jgi:hypothetical protein